MSAEKATKKLVYTEDYGLGTDYYNIYVGEDRVAEYVSSLWSDIIVKCLNTRK